tara:strand:- start:4 stop:636 length:633 start_codon:yes stop_codon:yes gene_type:complete
MAACTKVQRMIQQVFVEQIDAHPLTFATAREMYRTGDTPLIIVACWWMAFKFEETNSTLTVDEVHHMFPTIVDPDQYSLQLRNAEKTVLARQNFRMPYMTRVREIYDLLPTNSAHEYHDWLTTLQDYRVIHMLSASHWVSILTPALQRTRVSPTLQLLALTFRRRHRQHLCPTTPRIGFKRTGPVLVTTGGVRKKSRNNIPSIRIIDRFK